MSRFAPFLEELKAFYIQHRTLCRGIVAAWVGITVFRLVKRQKKTKVRKDYPRDTVILHHIGRGPYAPSLVPFAVKLETYLRMAKILYQSDFSFERSSKHKYPWITYNGEEIADSAFIIEFLNKYRNVDLSSWLSKEQRAIALAFQRMMEENLYWVLFVTRWVNEVDADFMQRAIKMPFAVQYARFFISPRLRRMSWLQGMGRHSKDEVRQIAHKDLTALANFLGQKKFLMGDQPCEEDCAVFGQLSQLYWQLPGSIATMFKEEFPQLVAYCERMKDTFWPDWVECTTRGGTVEATR